MTQNANNKLVILDDPATLRRDAETRALRGKVTQALHASRFGTKPSTSAPQVLQLGQAPELRVDTLIDKANEALDRMSQSNPNRWLILQMGAAINELVRRVETAEAELRLLKTKQGE